MQSNRQDRLDAVTSVNYRGILELEEMLEADQNTLELLKREQEHLRAQVVLTEEKREDGFIIKFDK